MCRQVGEYALEHGDLDDRQHLLGRRVGEGPQARPLSAYQDDGSHPVVVVVPAEVVVVVLAAVVVVVPEPPDVVVVEPEAEPLAVVDVVPDLAVADVVAEMADVVVVVGTAFAAACWTAATRVWVGAGSVVPLGTKPTEMISVVWRKRIVLRSPV
jgi:hypothetical protein